ncbi:MAG: hypothetical protein STSR0007_12700 [Thermovirga sp.]
MIHEKHDHAGEDICEAVIFEARKSGLTICIAESCTGGLIGGALTEIAGASSAFLGSVVCYSNDAKVRILGVNPDILVRCGAVSGECAAAMATGARTLFRADIALSVTGVAGPGGGTEEKPVGLVWFSVESPWQRDVFPCSFSGGRGRIRLKAVQTALETLLRIIGRRPG